MINIYIDEAFGDIFIMRKVDFGKKKIINFGTP